MKKWSFILGIAMIAIFILFSDSFGDTRWKQIGPEGGSVGSLAINPQSPDTIYAGTYGGGVFTKYRRSLKQCHDCNCCSSATDTLKKGRDWDSG